MPLCSFIFLFLNKCRVHQKDNVETFLDVDKWAWEGALFCGRSFTTFSKTLGCHLFFVLLFYQMLFLVEWIWLCAPSSKSSLGGRWLEDSQERWESIIFMIKPKSLKLKLEKWNGRMFRDLRIQKPEIISRILFQDSRKLSLGTLISKERIPLFSTFLGRLRQNRKNQIPRLEEGGSHTLI